MYTLSKKSSHDVLCIEQNYPNLHDCGKGRLRIVLSLSPPTSKNIFFLCPCHYIVCQPTTKSTPT